MLLTFIIGASYAYIAYTTRQEGINVLETDCINVTMEELTNEIRLTNTYPVTDEVGSNLKPFRFKLTNTCGVGVDYNLNLEVMGLVDEKSESNPDGKENRIASKNIAVKVDENAKSILSSNQAAIPTYKESDYTAVESYTTYSGSIDPYGSITHEVRIWLDASAGNDSQNGKFYSKVVIEAKQNQVVFNQDLRKLAEIIETEPKYMDEFLEAAEDVNKIVASQEAMELIVNSEYLQEAIKTSPNYTDEIRKKILNTTVVSEVDKYNAGLPFYVFKNGNTGFTWTANPNSREAVTPANTNSDIREGVASATTSLYIADNSSTYYMVKQLYSQNLNLSNYQNLGFSFTFNGSCSGTSGQYQQETAHVGINSASNIWNFYYNCSNQSGEIIRSIANISSGSIKVSAKAYGRSSYTMNFSIPIMYVY